jgi:bacillithiol system protein YtxJ
MVIQLRQERDFEQLLERSKTDPVLIFKHSTQCPISAQACEEFTQFAESAGGLVCGLILVIENRNLSDAISEQLKVRHESPQAIVIKNGQATWHASHWSITADSLSDALRSYGQPAHQRN